MISNYSKEIINDIIFALDSTTIIAFIDSSGYIKYANHKFCEISKYNYGELIGEKYQIFDSTFLYGDFFYGLEDSISSGNVLKGDIKTRAKDGTFYWVNTTIIPLFNEQRKAYQYVFVQTDITDRKKTEETLQETLKELENSNKELQDIKNALDDSSIIAITDITGSITYVNDTFCEISKYDRDEFIGKDLRKINSNHHSKDFFKCLWKTVKRGEVWKGEIKNKAKDGTFYWVQSTIVPFFNKQGSPYQYVSIQHDITDKKKAEVMLLRSEKLSAIGELAAGIAHEIRNPLTTLKGFTIFLNSMESDVKKKEYYTLLLEEIERINFIVGEFMVLAKPQTIHLKRTSLIPIITKVCKFLESELNLNNVVIELVCENEDVYVECEEHMIKQVFLNFIKNAIEAMPDGGTIKIKVFINNNKVQITFIDEGKGIPEDQVKKLGEPFFTTKEKGNGLGLMVCFKIIQMHNGKIFIQSKENKGTMIDVSLPYKGLTCK
ncbi:PAS domain S-box protein [Robertmurraya korlensis]|uniref:PAS domain-containing protein n=1 Tax=Robertmurraya korlensis TaxID=519977 RepID=UPI002041B267|nr:PAS domain-containing protein [Robertmurraya korlensis]MCM3599913.1 PAS domain S-box protein [Robertmurraya korlensis]